MRLFRLDIGLEFYSRAPCIISCPDIKYSHQNLNTIQRSYHESTIRCSFSGRSAFLGGQLYAAEEVTLKTPKDKLSYIIGVQIGNDLKSQSIDVDPVLVSKGPAGFNRWK